MKLLAGASFILAASAALVTSASAASRHATATDLRLYAPFNGGAVAAGIQVARQASGYCWTSSLADARGDAYRCFVGNYIYDPCFANEIATTRYVLCPLYFPDSKVLRINLTKRLPSNSGTATPTRYSPWAVLTSTGKWCSILTGATGSVAGLRINYGCAGGGVLLGSPQRGTTWTIFYAPSFKSNHYQSITLRAAWW